MLIIISSVRMNMQAYNDNMIQVISFSLLYHQLVWTCRLTMIIWYKSFLFHSFIRWVQAECKKLGDTDNPEVSDFLKKAVRCLKERPVLFKYCAEEVIMYLLHREVTTNSNDIWWCAIFIYRWPTWDTMPYSGGL